jgi:Mrp family chromosome partitioning ATPase/capsular polysaccharide biosynthesis protein
MTPSTWHRHSRGLLRTHAWLILAATAVTLGVAAAVASASPPTYTSSAQVVVHPQPTTGAPLQPQMGTERTIAESGAVAELAAERLGTSPDQARSGLSVSVVLETTVLEIKYTAATAEAAADGARAFTYAFVNYRNDAAKVAEVVTDPELPVSSSRSNRSLVLGLGLLAGLALGVGAAWTWDRVTDRLRDAGELEELTGLPVLGALPRWDLHAGDLAPHGPAREALGFLAARVLALNGASRHGVITVTGPRRGGGTTTVAVNTALALAAQGREVVLVGADLSAPRLHECLGLAPTPGLLDVLDGDTTAESALQRTRWPNLRVLTAGITSATEHPLHVDHLRLALAHLAAHALVVVDAPPLLVVPDSLILAEHADVVLLVADLRSGTRSDASDAVGFREHVPAQPAGWVANRPQRPNRRGSPHQERGLRETVTEEPRLTGIRAHS